MPQIDVSAVSSMAEQPTMSDLGDALSRIFAHLIDQDRCALSTTCHDVLAERRRLCPPCGQYRLARLLAERGEGHGGLREIRGRYLRGPSGGVRLQVETALRRDGTAVPVDAVFDLGQIVAGAAT